MNPNEQELNLILVGETNVQGRDDPVSAFEHVLPLLKSADVLFGHLEAPLTPPSLDPTCPDIPHKGGWRHSGPDAVKAFSAAGFDAVSLASNVMYGARAALDTVETLDRAGIAHCGAGHNVEEARQPARVTCRGVRFGFLSYTSIFWPVGHAAGPDTPGVATVRAHTAYQPGRRALEMPGAPPTVVTWADPGELREMEADIRHLRQTVDILVVSIHWGLSGSTVVIDYQREVGHAAIHSGADLVLGHHPHRPQGIEIVDGRPIFYCTGNFAFDWVKMAERNLDGILIKCHVRNCSLRGVSFVPVQRNQDNLVVPLAADRGPGQAIVDQIRELSLPFDTRMTIQSHEAIVEIESLDP